MTCFLDHFQHWAAYDIRLPEGQVGGKSIALRMWTHIQVLASAWRRRLLQIEGQLLAACRLLTTAAALWDRETSAPPHKGRRPIQRFGRLQMEKAAQDFNLDDVATDMELWVWFPCERCGRGAKLHFRRELKPAH